VLSEQQTTKNYIVDLASSKELYDPRQPFPPPTGGVQTDRAIAPDGNHAMYFAASNRSLGPLWIARRNSPKQNLLTPLNSENKFAWSPDGKHLAFISFAYQQYKPVVSFVVTDSDGSDLHSVEVPREMYRTTINYASWLSNDSIHFGGANFQNGTQDAVALLNTNNLKWTALASDVSPDHIFLDPENRTLIVAWREVNNNGVDGYDSTGKRLFRFQANDFSFGDTGRPAKLFVSHDGRSLLTHQSTSSQTEKIRLTNDQFSRVIWQTPKTLDQKASYPAWPTDSTMFAFAVSTVSLNRKTELRVFAADGKMLHQFTIDTSAQLPNFTIRWSNCN
jgi:hypothetical protein